MIGAGLVVPLINIDPESIPAIQKRSDLKWKQFSLLNTNLSNNFLVSIFKSHHDFEFGRKHMKLKLSLFLKEYQEYFLVI